MSLLDRRGRFHVNSLLNLYCPKCQTIKQHRVVMDEYEVNELVVCTRCKRISPLPEEYRMRELKQPLLFKEI